MACFVFDSLKETNMETREMFGLQIILRPDHLGTWWKLELRARQVMKRETSFLQEKKERFKGDLCSPSRSLRLENFRQLQPLHFAVAQFMRSWKRTLSFFLISHSVANSVVIPSCYSLNLSPRHLPERCDPSNPLFHSKSRSKFQSRDM